jgi:hypothetical protein
VRDSTALSVLSVLCSYSPLHSVLRTVLILSTALCTVYCTHTLDLILGASLHPDGKKFIAGGSDLWVRVFDAASVYCTLYSLCTLYRTHTR